VREEEIGRGKGRNLVFSIFLEAQQNTQTIVANPRQRKALRLFYLIKTKVI
jgi:hypothetical protein